MAVVEMAPHASASDRGASLTQGCGLSHSHACYALAVTLHSGQTNSKMHPVDARQSKECVYWQADLGKC